VVWDRLLITGSEGPNPHLSRSFHTSLRWCVPGHTAIIVLNPAEPPLIMRDTVYCLCEPADEAAVERSVEAMVAAVQAYVPGYRMKQRVQFERIGDNRRVRLPATGKDFSGLKVTVLLEVEGAAHYLPAYSGNLDIMTSAALRTAERLVELDARGMAA